MFLLTICAKKFGRKSSKNRWREKRQKSFLTAIFICKHFFLTKAQQANRQKLVDDESVELYISRDVFNEVKNVLSRPEFQVKFPHATSDNLTIFLEHIKEKAIFVRSVGKHFELARDKKDEPYLNLAIEIHADFIVSWDRDLLDLMTDISVTGKEFRQKSRPMKIVEPIEFLKIIEKEI